MRIEAVEIDGGIGKKEKRILIDRGTGPLEARFSTALPGYKAVGVFFYPALELITIHVIKESK